MSKFGCPNVGETRVSQDGCPKVGVPSEGTDDIVPSLRPNKDTPDAEKGHLYRLYMAR